MRNAVSLGMAGAISALGLCTLYLLGCRFVGALQARKVQLWSFLIAWLAGVSVPDSDVSEPLSPSELTIVATVESHYDRNPPTSIIRVNKVEPSPAKTGFWPPRKSHATNAHPITGTQLIVRQALSEGATYRMRISFRPLIRFRNPGLAPPLSGRGELVGFATIQRNTALERVRFPFYMRWRQQLRRRVRSSIRATLNPRAAAVARAVVLGESYALEPQDRDAIRSVGLAHLLAVSGLHVGLSVALFMQILCRIMRCTGWLTARYDIKRIASFVAALLAPLYASFAGGSPSAVRAGCMLSILLFVCSLGRRPNLHAVLALAVLLMTAAQPSLIHAPSFLLSVCATAAVLTTPTDAMDRSASSADITAFGAVCKRILHQMRQLLRITLRVTIATAPILLYCVQSLPTVGLLANLIGVPFACSLLIPAIMFHVALVAVSEDLGPYSGAVLNTVIETALAWVRQLAAVSPTLELAPTPMQALLLSALAILILWGTKLRWRAHLTVVVLMALIGTEVALRIPYRDRLRITTLDIGQGDATLIEFPDGRSMLIDTGGSGPGQSATAARTLIPMLRYRRRTKIDVLALTHFDRDHAGGVEALLKSIDVSEVWLTRQAERESRNRLPTPLRAIRDAQLTEKYPSSLCGPQHFGSATVEVLHPCPSYDPGMDPNDNSLVLRISLGPRSALFTGDIEAMAEKSLASPSLKSEILKVPHHGSHTSSTEAFLRAVKPRYAVISAGRYNRFGHPHPSVTRRLENRAVQLFRTDLHGAVVFETEGGPWTVRSAVPFTERMSTKASSTKASSTKGALFGTIARRDGTPPNPGTARP